MDDIKCLVDGDSVRGSAKCGLRNLGVGRLPLEVHGEDVETVVVGFKAIFPCLTDLTGYNGRQYKLGSELWD